MKLAKFVALVADGPQTEEDNQVFNNWTEEVTAWKANFSELHRLREMRVYPHIIVDHGKQIFDRHGPLSALSQQGMEHANKRDVLTWYRHTSRGGGSVKVCLMLLPFPFTKLT